MYSSISSSTQDRLLGPVPARSWPEQLDRMYVGSIYNKKIIGLQQFIFIHQKLKVRRCITNDNAIEYYGSVTWWVVLIKIYIDITMHTVFTLPN